MNRLLLTGVALLGFLTVAFAKDPTGPELSHNSKDWRTKVAQAVNHPKQAADVIHEIKKSERADFAKDALIVLHDNPDKSAFEKEIGELVAALVSGAGDKKADVLEAISIELVKLFKNEDGVLTKEAQKLLEQAEQSIESQLSPEDSKAFSKDLQTNAGGGSGGNGGHGGNGGVDNGGGRTHPYYGQG